MVLCPDVASTVMKYLEPQCLVSFMMDERWRLGMEMKFVYDGSRHVMHFDECNKVYGMFPNMVLVGMHFYDMGCNRKFVMNVRKVTRCKVTCLNWIHTYEVAEQLEECVGVKVLSLIDYGKAVKKCDLSKCVNLHTINVVTKCSGSSQYLDGLSKCEGLKCLRLVGVKLCQNDVKEICKCSNLIHLEISDQITGSFVCDKLRSLVIRRFIDRNLNNIDCYGVKCILLENCEQMDDISKLKKFPNLECVEIVGCDRLKDVSVLDACVNLKWVRIEGNVVVSEKLSKLMESCGCRNRCGHKRKYGS